jgi:hypothetical protein
MDPDNSSATIAFRLYPRSLPEHTYSFTAHVPVNNGTSWGYYSIKAQFEVVAVADAALSMLSACQKAACAYPSCGVVACCARADDVCAYLRMGRPR